MHLDNLRADECHGCLLHPKQPGRQPRLRDNHPGYMHPVEWCLEGTEHGVHFDDVRSLSMTLDVPTS